MITTIQRVAMAIGSGWLAAGEPPLTESRWDRLSSKLRTELTGEAKLALIELQKCPPEILITAAQVVEASGDLDRTPGEKALEVWRLAISSILKGDA